MSVKNGIPDNWREFWSKQEILVTSLFATELGSAGFIEESGKLTVFVRTDAKDALNFLRRVSERPWFSEDGSVYFTSIIRSDEETEQAFIAIMASVLGFLEFGEIPTEVERSQFFHDFIEAWIGDLLYQNLVFGYAQNVLGQDRVHQLLKNCLLSALAPRPESKSSEPDTDWPCENVS